MYFVPENAMGRMTAARSIVVQLSTARGGDHV